METLFRSTKPIEIGKKIHFYRNDKDYSCITRSLFCDEETALLETKNILEIVKKTQGDTEWWLTPETRPINMDKILKENGFAKIKHFR